MDLKGYQFTDSYRYSLLEDSSQEKFNDEDVWLGSFAYVRSPFYYTDANRNIVRDEIIDYNNVLTLGYTRYLSEKWSLGADLHAVQNKVFNESYSTLGDVLVRAKYLITSRDEDWSLSLNPFLTLPTGKEANFTSARPFSAGLRAVMEKHWSRWHLIGSLGYSHAPDNQYLSLDYRNLLLSQLGISFDLNDSWNANAEITRNFTLAADEDQDEGDYFFTIKNKTTARLSLYGGAGIAGFSGVERNNYTAFVGFKLQEEGKKQIPVATKPAPVTKRDQESRFGVMIGVDNIYFANNESKVIPVEREKVIKIVKLYKKLGHRFSKVVVEGFSSKRGNTVQNEVLSLSRVAEVIKILRAEGVPSEFMTPVSYGDQMKQDPEEWRNRRVQFRIYKK